MKKLTVASISTRNLVGQPEQALVNMRQWIDKAKLQGAEFVLFPELNVTGYIQHPSVRATAEPIPGPSTEKAIQLARETGVTIACGILERADEQFYCTHVLVNGDGLIGKQRKIHTPIQEQPFWGFGDSIETFNIGNAKVGIAICRDSFFDEMTRTQFFKGAEIMLMPFGYYNVNRSRYLKETIHGMSIIKACWTNGTYAMICNSAEFRPASEIEPNGMMFPGWAGVIGPWGNILSFVDHDGNDESMVVVEIGPEALQDRRSHPNFLAQELRTALYQFEAKP
jgi:predicted amidohydrolase